MILVYPITLPVRCVVFVTDNEYVYLMTILTIRSTLLEYRFSFFDPSCVQMLYAMITTSL
jgi:hypothetical protein